MGLKDSLSFKGTNATQLLRTQHVISVDISEAFLANAIAVKDVLDHVDYTIEVHFKLEDEILLPALSPYLQKFLEFQEPIRIIRGEHVSIKSMYRSVFSARSFESEDSVRTQEEVHAATEQLSRTMLQHIFKEENGIFPMADIYIPESERSQISSKMESMLKNLHESYVLKHPE